MDIKRQQAINMLVEKYEKLDKKRTPKRTDFNDDDICFIKQKLGPWPRALEAAGIKVKIRPDSKELSKAKRERIRKQKV